MMGQADIQAVSSRPDRWVQQVDTYIPDEVSMHCNHSYSIPDLCLDPDTASLRILFFSPAVLLRLIFRKIMIRHRY